MAKAAMLDNLKESPEQISGWFGRGRRFLTDVKAELGRVSWPTGREVRATTWVVILVSAMFGVYLYIVDLTLSALAKWFFDRFGA